MIENKGVLLKLVDIKIETRGFDEVAKQLGEFETKRTILIRDTLLECANEFLNTIQFLAPRATGNYADSWVIQNISDRSIKIGTPHEELFIYLEYGTAPHPIVGHRKVLHWVSWDGVDHFAFWVRHPGFAAIPHLRPATNVLEVKIPEIVLKNMKKHLRIVNG